MSRRTLRGAIPTTDTVVASGPAVFRPAPVPSPTDDPSTGDPTTDGTGVDTDTVLLRGVAAARARPLDLVAGVPQATTSPMGAAPPVHLDAVAPWAEELEQTRELARASGFHQGRQEGLAAGLEASRTQCDAHRAELSALVENVLDGLTARAVEVGDELAAQVVDLALEVARAVIDREVAAAEDPGADAIARCLDLVPDTGALVVRLNPDDAAKLGRVPGIGDRKLVVAADPSLESGDAIVGVDQITIDARLSESMRRVEEALR